MQSSSATSMIFQIWITIICKSKRWKTLVAALKQAHDDDENDDDYNSNNNHNDEANNDHHDKETIEQW